jgi:cyclic pyranopterin phosphate synthase
MSELTHLVDDGRARMVDVGAKPTSERRAVARARLRMEPATARAVERGDGPKGEVLGVARIAGVQAAKQTSSLIPLCHPLPLSYVDVAATVDTEAGLVELLAEARTVGQTGVEMEAMTAASVAALTVYDMVKGLERGVAIEGVVLVSKSGGRSGEWRLEEPASGASGPSGAASEAGSRAVDGGEGPAAAERGPDSTPGATAGTDSAAS